MRRVQRCAGRRRYPCGVGAGLGVTDLLLEHVCHQLGHGPHALADLRLALQAAGQSGVDVPVLVRTDPLLLLHLGLAHHRAGFHGGVDLVAGAVEEAGVDEHDAVDGFLDAGGEVDRRTTLLVHDADLERVLRKPEDLLDTAEQFGGEGNFLGTVLLGLDDVDRAGAAVVERSVGVTDREAVHCTGTGDQASRMPSGTSLPSASRIAGLVMR